MQKTITKNVFVRVLLGLTLLLSGCGKSDGRPIGIQNKNYLNIRANKNNDWKGSDGERGGFVKFTSPEYGYRAASIILKKHIRKGLTLSQIISKWAPPSDGNNTKNYISFVSKETGIAPNERVRESQLPILMAAMTRREIGCNPCSVEEIQKSISL